MADPLSLLQKYTTGNIQLQKINQNGELYYVFDDVAYPHSAKTNLGVYNKPDEYYSIESILLFWEMRELQHTAYVRDVSGRGIASITRVQRRELLDFLNGGTLPKEANMLAPIPPPIPATQLQQDEQFKQQQKSHFEPEKKKPRLEHEKKGQRIDKILDQSNDKVTSASEVRGLSSDLPAEKVAQLRSRIKNNLKNKTIDEESLVFSTVMSAIPSASSDAIGTFITEKERIRKDRTTCLESTSRNFSAVIAVIKDLQIRENQAKFPHTQTAATTSMGQNVSGIISHLNSTSGRAPQKPIAGGYSRYDQEIFQRETVADFEIETDLSFHERNAAMMNKQQQAVSASSSCNPSSQTNGVHQKGRIESTILQQQQRQQPTKRVSRTPIIIIPASGTTLITMYNAQDILQDLRYISSDEKKRTYKRENELLLQIRKNGATVPYRVIDNPTKLKDEEWERVVAVFVQGPAWQFKGWKWNGNPVEIFANIAAFHLKFEEQKLDPNVAKWSVNVLQLSRTKRHLDRAILQKFWEILYRHIAKSNKRDWLRY